jgi:hypothetical protein
MINGNGFIASDGVNGTVAPWITNGNGGSGTYPTGSPANARWGADAVRPAWFGGSGDSASLLDTIGAFNSAAGTFTGGGIGSILNQLSSMVSQYIGRLGAALTGSSSTTTSTTSRSNATSFQNVTLGSTGDPHLSATGTSLNPDGTTASVNTKYDSMTGHNDLFSTRDFGDGFRVATTVTQPSANGVTMNASATATMDGGLESVSMTNNGTVSVTNNGTAVTLAAGQSIQLANGATVSEAANGTVSLTESRFGSNLTTTFTNNGAGGVDVTASGNNVTLAGDLINKR